MSDDASQRKLLKSDFLRFRNTKFPSLRCPACRERNFNMMTARDAPQDDTALMADMIESSTIFGTGYRSYGMICNNCGYIMTFFRDVVLSVIDGLETT